MMKTLANSTPLVKPVSKLKPKTRQPLNAVTDFELLGYIARREFPGLFLSRLKGKVG